jgi:hypothetical protein
MVVPPILAPGDYVLVGWLGTEAETIVVREILAFSLWPGPRDTSEAIRRIRIVQPGVEWNVEAVDSAPEHANAEGGR